MINPNFINFQRDHILSLERRVIFCPQVNHECDIEEMFPLFAFSATFDWPKGKWIKANHKQFGYYRVNYDRQNWEKLAEVLKDNHEVFFQISLLEFRTS